ncbi:MAG: hypothetical protein ACOY3K_02920 [Candidatus Omnitrophota bacterium]
MIGGKWVKETDRVGQWVLLFILLLYVLSGYGMTKRILDPDLARWLHFRFLPIPLFLCFLIHTLIPVNSQFRKWRLFESERATDLFTYLLFGAVLGLFLWLFFG